MKKTFTSFLTTMLLICFANMNSQTALPYFTGFDNTADNAAWTLYKKISTTSGPWGYQTQLAYSTPSCLAHYYPIGDLTLDWLVSPAFNFTGGGKIDSVRFAFTGFSPTPSTADTVAIFLLVGSPDPDLATAKISLLDFRGTNYVSDDNWRDTTNIAIPPTPGQSYIAFKYKASTSWLDVRFDNLRLSANGSAPVAAFSVSPNPACAGQSITFTDQSTNTPNSWNWTFAGGSPATSTLSNPSVTFAQSGTHSVTLTAANGFGSHTVSQSITVDPCTGLAAIKQEDINPMVFPNPGPGKFVFTHGVKHQEFTVFNILGDEIVKGLLDENGTKTVDLESHPGGIYFLNTSGKTYKLVKE